MAVERSSVASWIWPLPGWALAALLIVMTAAIGPALGSVVRPIFILICGAIGVYTWRQGPADHLQAALVLFCFAALVRRMVDVTAGYDASGLMLVGPLVTILAPAMELNAFLDGKRFANSQIGPIMVVGGCLLYATFLSIFQGDWMNAASGSLKSFAPIIYVSSILLKDEDSEKLIEAAASAFVYILPIMGLYGIYQYIDPPAWDIYWMKSATILSAGQPVPYGVRTFSVLNSPASFATFTAAGLMLVLFLRQRPLALLLALPAAIAFLLSMYRTGWLSMVAGIAFCALRPVTQRRAALTILAIIAAVGIAMLTPFGDVISDRLGTLGRGSDDGSARERLEEYYTLWNQPDSGMFGIGFSTTDVGSAGSMPIDGMIVANWISMGFLVGMVCIAALVVAAGSAIFSGWTDRKPASVIVGALACGALVQLPLAGIMSGELGFLFWTFVVLIPRPPRDQKLWTS